MTLTDIENYGKDWLTCAQVATVLGACPDTIRGQAHDCPEKLGFPVSIIGRRVKIPRLPFIKFMKGEEHVQA
jgi:hypothetical protein